MTKPVRSVARGTVLCVRHAKQVVTEAREPDGECHPRGLWTNGVGEAVACDVVVAPDRVRAYLVDREREV